MFSVGELPVAGEGSSNGASVEPVAVHLRSSELFLLHLKKSTCYLKYCS